MKHFKRILPDYPRVRHIPWKPNASRDDLACELHECQMIFSQPRTEVTEKVDGSNVGIAFYEGEPIIRNHNHVMRKGYSKETPAKQQFATIFNWFYENKPMFERLNEIGGPVGVYGEWMVAQHGLEYDNLPSLFIAFDLYDYEMRDFVAADIARDILTQAGFTMVPLLYSGAIQSFEQLEELANQPSPFTTKGNREGIYVKVSDDRKVTDRFKMVRQGFVQGGLWNTDSLKKNRLRP